MKINFINGLINIFFAPVLLWIYHIVLKEDQKIVQIGPVDGAYIIFIHIAWLGFGSEVIYPNLDFPTEHIINKLVPISFLVNALLLCILGNRYMKEYAEYSRQEFWKDVKKIANQQSDQSADQGRNNYPSDSQIDLDGLDYYCDGTFASGDYNSETRIYIKGPMLSFDIFTHRIFYSFYDGTFKFKDDNTMVSIRTRISEDKRIVPTVIHINGDLYMPVDSNGAFFSSIQTININNIHVSKTVSIIIDQLKNYQIRQITSDTIVGILIDMITFNMLTRNKIITEFDDDYILVAKEYKYNFEDKYKQFREIIINKLKDYLENSEPNEVEKWLSVLELPSDTDEISIIKRQYRNLAKKYHPDLHDNTAGKMKEINIAYGNLQNYFTS